MKADLVHNANVKPTIDRILIYFATLPFLFRMHVLVFLFSSNDLKGAHLHPGNSLAVRVLSPGFPSQGLTF